MDNVQSRLCCWPVDITGTVTWEIREICQRGPCYVTYFLVPTLTQERKERKKKEKKSEPKERGNVTFFSPQKESRLTIKFKNHEKKKPFRYRDHCLKTGGLPELICYAKSSVSILQLSAKNYFGF